MNIRPIINNLVVGMVSRTQGGLTCNRKKYLDLEKNNYKLQNSSLRQILSELFVLIIRYKKIINVKKN